MTKKIRVGIVGYGNLGRGAEASIAQQPDMELVAIFSRRGAEAVQPLHADTTVEHIDEAINYVDAIDVMILCGGSATDLPEQTPAFAKLFNTVDSYDTHANIPVYYDSVNEVAQKSGKTSLISVGWDPGLFSINRVMAEAILPKGETYTFWGKGLSQGHSDAVRRVAGVKAGVQYTIPSEEAIARVRQGENPDLSKEERHKRVCYIVAEEGAVEDDIKEAIVSMPNYFVDYDTTVHFITDEEMKQDHQKMPHGGFVIRSGETGDGNKQIYEFSLALDSNPAFTSSVLVAYARAAYRMNKEGRIGAKTVYDVAPTDISSHAPDILRKHTL